MASVDVLFSLASTVSRTMRPLQDSLVDEDAFSSFLLEFGWVVAPTSFSIGNVRAALPTATALTNADGILAEIQASDSFPPAIRYVDLLDAFLTAIEGLEALPGSPPPAGIPSGAWTTFSSELLNHLIDAYLKERQPGSLGALLAAGIVTEDQIDPGVAGRVPYIQVAISWDRLGQLFTDPSGLITEVYDWNKPGATLRFDILLARLGRIFPLLGLPTVSAVPSEARLDEYYAAGNPHRPDIRELRLTLIQGEDPGGSLDFSLVFLPIPETGDSNGPPRGLAIGPSIVITGVPPPTLFAPFGLTATGEGGTAKYEGARVELVPSGPKVRLPASSDTTLNARVRLEDVDESPRLILGSLYSHRLQYKGIGLEFGARGTIDDPEVILGIDVIGGQVVIDLSDGDGLMTDVMGEDVRVIEFGVGLVWSSKTGFHLRGSGVIDIVIPLNISFAGFTVISVHLRAASIEGQVSLTVGIAASFQLGPVTASVADIGTKMELVPVPAGQPSGMFGRLDLDFGFKPPNGIGIAIDAGSVKGGGFLFLDFDIGRYSGVIELSVFSIGVKAFGVVDTQFPDGSKGYSFVIIIVAEFTPIQLGFGFTLLGVGGMIGINRSVNEQGLGDAVRTGSLEHLLFPRNPVRDAPAIVHDLSTVFPAAKGHFIVGPLAKFGWGTPTLITAELGIIIELPGPRLGVLGVVRMQLPRPDFALLSLQMAVAGILDFPGKRFSLDAGLYDSHVAGYQVTGDMAYRLGFGGDAAFLLSVGGFNPGFDAPPGVPELRRAAVDLGVNGNPSLVASGYLALTSNTAQVGASLELNASGHGIRLHGWLGFDALFVFSPFSFIASISAGVRVSFHGVGLGVSLHGSLSGPTPWIFKGKVCVSVLWWDACLPIEVKFARREPASLPEIDPWLGRSDPDGRINVRGLREAIEDTRSWSGSNPPAGFSVVNLAAAATEERTPIDPLGPANLRQKVAPLNQKLEKFGEYKPLDRDEFVRSSVLINGEEITEVEPVEDKFVPGHFLELTNAEKMSMDSYVPMEAGFSIAPNRLKLGSSGSQVLEYETKYINEQGQVFINQPGFRLTQQQLTGLLKRSAPALKGSRRSGAQRYVTPNRPKRVTFEPKNYVVADACTALKNSAITADGVSQVKALLALRSHVAANPADQGRFAVVPSYAAR